MSFLWILPFLCLPPGCPRWRPRNVGFFASFLVSDNSKWTGCKFEIISIWHLSWSIPIMERQNKHFVVPWSFWPGCNECYINSCKVVQESTIFLCPFVIQLRFLISFVCMPSMQNRAVISPEYASCRVFCSPMVILTSFSFRVSLRESRLLSRYGMEQT